MSLKHHSDVAFERRMMPGFVDQNWQRTSLKHRICTVTNNFAGLSLAFDKAINSRKPLSCNYTMRFIGYDSIQTR